MVQNNNNNNNKNITIHPEPKSPKPDSYICQLMYQSSVTTIAPQIWLVDPERSIELNRHYWVPYYH